MIYKVISSDIKWYIFGAIISILLVLCESQAYP